ncbi:MAG: beta-ketoacyl-[acyl-carrier-protein] synthase family protein [Chromatiales bacterium]|jgi:nodulation protein E
MDGRVLVTGLGAVSALGCGVPRLLEGLTSGTPGFGPIVGLPPNDLRTRIGAQVRDFDPGGLFAAKELPLLDRFSQLALVAGREAIADAGLSPAELVAAAAVVGTGCGGKETDEETYVRLYKEGRSRAHPFTIPKGMPSAAASQVSMGFGIQGPVFSVASACSSAAHAIAQAAAMIRAGLVDLALAGGTDAPFTVGLMKAWEALRVLTNDSCRPFSRDRSGIVLGEGAGMLVLESEGHARRRGARVRAEMAGAGMSSDAGHITDPSPDGAARAMRAALADAGMAPGDIDYVNAHGTGTQANDLAETQALHAVFGEHARRLAVSSTKSLHGHALGASGALEAAASVLALETGVIPPTANFTEPGEGCDLDYVPNQAREAPVQAVLSSSFAFGGLNAVLAFRAWHG